RRNTRSVANPPPQPLDDQRLRSLVELGDDVDVFRLEADRGPCPPPLQQDPTGFTRDADGDLARLFQGIVRPHSPLRIQVAFFERASAYSAVAWIGATTSLRSIAAKPSFSPKYPCAPSVTRYRWRTPCDRARSVAASTST